MPTYRRKNRFGGASHAVSIAMLVCVSLFSARANAQPPAGYYTSADTTNATTLRQSVHAIIKDHTRFPYTSSATDTWDILEMADEDPNNSGNVLDVYKNESYPKQGGGNTLYNREHSWPKSYSFPNDVSTNYPYTDCHHLFIVNDSYNSTRSNKPYRTVSPSATEYPTLVNNGRGGPGQSNWSEGSFTTGGWETWIGRRGDVARALFYLDVRYEGGTHGITGAPEPDLILTDNEALIAASNTGSNESVGYMGLLSVLLEWHLADPVDAQEQWRNEVVSSFQGNRNPFIDHPEWVACIFNDDCGGGGGDTTPPAAPSGLGATPGNGQVDLAWSPNGEPDLSGYNVYRSTTSGGPYTKRNGPLVVAESYTDTGATNGTTYYYVVRAVDTSFNESSNGNQASATPQGGGGGTPTGDPWINEFHYDNNSTDVGEFVEIAGPAGLDLAGWTVVGYNGNGGGTYATIALSGVIPDQSNCAGALAFNFAGMQNGSPDGLALVDDTGAVLDFVSYEGSFAATNGPASGMTSTDVGVSEASTSPLGFSLQLGDAGWQGSQAETPGAVNTGQTFPDLCGGGGGDTTPPAAPTGLGVTAGEASVSLDWADNGEGDLAGYTVYRATTSGGPYSAIATGLVASDHVDAAASNGTTYYYVVTATDTSSNESNFSGEASATPQDTTAPAAPTSLIATAADAQVQLVWAANGEPDLNGYNVYRATASGGPYGKINGSLVVLNMFTDTGAANGTTYYYVVRAVDTSSNESGNSNEASATPQDTTPPDPPTGLGAAAGDGAVDLDWADNAEPDLASYTVYRSTVSGSGYGVVASGLATSDYSDATVTNGTTYYYVVTATDGVGNESAASAEISATPQGGGGGGPSGNAWINEFHYDNDGADTGEFVEIAGEAGLDLTGWSVVGYNGSGGAAYQTVALSGSIPDQGGCAGAVAFAFVGMQNGSPDGLALVDSGGVVIEFLSYEGSFLATDGPATGLTSTDVGVSEASTAPLGSSLQLGDAGWQSSQAETPGAQNTGQAIGDLCGPGGDTTPPAAPTGLAAVAGDGSVDLDWADNGETDFAGYTVYRSTVSGSGYGAIVSGLTASAYTDATAVNGTTYYYVVTAVDTSSNESAASGEASATPQAPVGWTELSFDDFESGWGTFNDGGADASLYTGGTFAHQGSAAADIQDNSGASASVSSDGLDLSGSSQMKVEFWFRGVSMENNEDFFLEFSDGGAGWEVIDSWAAGSDFSNDQFVFVEVVIDSASIATSFTADNRIRFRCDASGNSDDVYIDEIRISAQ